MHNCKFYLLALMLTVDLMILGLFCAQLCRPIGKQRCFREFFSFSYYAYGILKLFIQIRIDATGNREYTQFEASPHPPMKPMAYVQGGLSSLMMM